MPEILQPLILDGLGLRILDVCRYVKSWHNDVPLSVEQFKSAWERIDSAAALVAKMAAGCDVVYGVTTGVGDLARECIPPEKSAELQRSIVRSHAAGWGKPFDEDIIRAAMLVRLNTWAKGHSGLRRETVQLYLDMLNHGIVPLAYEHGSLGASGDLAPLSMMALVVIGEGEAWLDGERMPGAMALQRCALAPVELSYKEALALINGTTVMAGEGALLLRRTRCLYSQALRAYALCVEALGGRTDPYAARVHAACPHPGQAMVAAHLRWSLRGSGYVNRDDAIVQDAYSLRCIPQIAGPSFETLNNAERTVEIELNSASDNPLFWPDAESGPQYIAAGNFHGQSLAMAFDFLAIATAEIASLAERQTNRLMDRTLSGLPAFLAAPGGVNSGLMVAHYTQASLVSEARTLCHPAVVDNIPTSADQEDHVNMGPVALRKYRTVLGNTEGVIAILLLCAAQAVDLRRAQVDGAEQLHLGAGTQRAYRAIRSVVPFMDSDRVLYPEIERVTGLVRDGAFA
jgi:histidine ammonia-lyase